MQASVLSGTGAFLFAPPVNCVSGSRPCCGCSRRGEQLVVFKGNVLDQPCGKKLGVGCSTRRSCAQNFFCYAAIRLQDGYSHKVVSMDDLFSQGKGRKDIRSNCSEGAQGGTFPAGAVREKGPSPSAGYGDLPPETRRRKNDALCECEKYPVCQEGMNIYRSCSHGCIYCDSRSLRYQGGHDFEDIEITANPIELLEQSTLKMWIALVVARATTSDRTHGKTTLFPYCEGSVNREIGHNFPANPLLSTFRLKRKAFQTIRPVVSRKNAVFPLTFDWAVLCRRLAFCLFKDKIP